MKTWKNFIRCAGALTALWLASAACAQCGTIGDVPVDDCLTGTAANTSWRIVGLYTSSGACPVPTAEPPGAWSTDRLFLIPDEPLPPGLRPFCLYTALTDVADPADVLDLKCLNTPDDGCLDDVNADQLAVTAQAGTGRDVENLLWPDFNQHFLFQSGAPGPIGATAGNARLTVIDTQPTGVDEDGNGPGASKHGFALLNLARDMICADGSACPVELQSGLGLPIQRCSNLAGAKCQCVNASAQGYCEVPADGGHMGTQAQLADAIYEAMRDFENSTGPSRIVINLSLGWNALYGGLPPLSSAPVSAQAVHAALEYVSCRGALVIAAAGNFATGPDAQTGPLLPGAWEQLEAPNLADCVTLLNPLTPDPSLNNIPAGAYRPLVYAVGAIDHEGQRLRMRPQGEPRLTAFGDHGVAAYDDAGIQTPAGILTGTSVSALVVATTAAAAWHFRPNAPAFAIMQSLYATGAAVPARAAQFCLNNGTSCNSMPVRRINSCEGIIAVCQQFPGAPCPTLTCPTEIPVIPEISIPDLDGLFASALSVDVSTFIPSPPIIECGDDYVVHYDPVMDVPRDPCPHRQYYGLSVTPWVNSQPDGDGCDVCTNQFSSPGNFYLEVAGSYLNQLRDVTLLCAGEGYHVADVLAPGDKLKITQIPENCETEELTIVFRVPGDNNEQASVMSLSLKAQDLDNDQIQDGADNCVLTGNAFQLDADADGIGNVCDADFDNNCFVNVIDLGIFRTLFFTNNPLADLNGDGSVNIVDLGIFRALFFSIPGPSGIPNICA